VDDVGAGSAEIKPRLEKALVDIASCFDAAGIDYMVIGGMANSIWGNARATTDVDITVAIDREHVREVFAALGNRVARVPPDLAEYLAGGVLPFTHRIEVHVDLLLSRHPYARAAIERAVTIKVLRKPVKFCTAEDLVLHKIISERDRDQRDVEAILRRRRKTLDREYLDPHVHELAVMLDRPEIEQTYRRLMDR